MNGIDPVVAEMRRMYLSPAQNAVEEAREFIREWGQVDGSHHKAWVIDQVLRILLNTEEEYTAWVADYEKEDMDGDWYEWDAGIAP